MEASTTGQATPATDRPTLAQVAERADVSAATVRRWVKDGLVPQYEGAWTPAAVAQVRIIGRLRSRGHTLEQIRRANESGQLAGYLQGMFAPPEGRYTLEQASEATGIDEGLIERIYLSLGLSTLSLDTLDEEDMEMLRYLSAMLGAGLPETVFLQLARVYGQTLAQIADAEVRLIHIYVHEPMMREGVPGVQMAEAMEGLAGELLPFAAPFMRYLHGRFLGHFIEQDVIGHMEAELSGGTLEEGRMRVVIAFADLAGYTRLTEERGDEEAVGVVERFVEAVEHSLPIDARVIKTLGDEVMVVGSDPVALTRWAVDFQLESSHEGPAPRIGIHYGEALYRDGDYYGRDVNQTARVVARAAGGEVLVTRRVVDVASGVDGLRFELIGEIGLKGFTEPIELFHALAPER
ncbi:MAG TPA: adenylate cyclase regulatory domain-containing protein [Solirubrobacteraceae bacterium]|nr:adenylate cyclase regulatory domain-containing protein [Solirubrobacteraceae bacterium]